MGKRFFSSTAPISAPSLVSNFGLEPAVDFKRSLN